MLKQDVIKNEAPLARNKRNKQKQAYQRALTNKESLAKQVGKLRNRLQKAVAHIEL
jgi:hypothetical protein